MKEEVYRKAEAIYYSINSVSNELKRLKQIAYDSLKQVQIGTYVLTTNEELNKQIIDTIIAYKEKQIEEWQEEFEKL